jgi:hypothetical protein
MTKLIKYYIKESLDFPWGEAFAWLAAIIVLAGMIRLVEFLFHYNG